MKTGPTKPLPQVIPLLFCLTLIAPSALATSYTYETFDVPTAVETWAQGINDSGQVAGYFMTTHNATPVNGFVRSATGSITTFYNTSDYCGGPNVTRAFAINSSGQISGYCLGGYWGYHHGFVRSADGSTYTSAIDDPDVVYASVRDTSGTSVTGINDSGQVTGYYTVSSATHGFLTNTNHTQFTTFDAPSTYVNTRPFGINNSGQISGYYRVGSNYSGFLRKTDGTYEKIDVPNGISGYTYAYGINNSGQVVGSYKGTDSHEHGFMRSADGLTYSTIDYPSASLTYAYDINNNGQITGIYKLSDGIVHGYIATPVVDPELSIAFAGSGSGTVTSTSPDSRINCTKGSSNGCSASFPASTSVTLAATGDWKSLFSDWSGGFTNSTNPVTFTLNTNTALTATFNHNNKVKLLPANTLFASIQDAYSSVSSGNISILAQTGTFPENLIFSTSQIVTLTGGMDSSYNLTSDFSAVSSVTVTHGSATVGKITIK